jgi:hypothetical protein
MTVLLDYAVSAPAFGVWLKCSLVGSLERHVAGDPHDGNNRLDVACRHRRVMTAPSRPRMVRAF